MKKFILSTIAVAMALFVIIGCGGGKPKVEMSKEMQEFVGMIKGKAADVKSALDKFGTDDTKGNDMSIYDLKEPVVTAKEADCYTLEAKAGVTTRTYKICWTGGKISKIDDLGMK